MKFDGESGGSITPFPLLALVAVLIDLAIGLKGDLIGKVGGTTLPNDEVVFVVAVEILDADDERRCF